MKDSSKKGYSSPKVNPVTRARAVKTAKKGPPGKAGAYMPKAKPPVPGSVTPAARKADNASSRSAVQAAGATRRAAAAKTAARDAAMTKKRVVRTAKKGGRYGKSVVS